MLIFCFSSGRVLKYNLILHGAYFFFQSQISKELHSTNFVSVTKSNLGKIDFDPTSATEFSCTIPLQIKFSFREV